MASRYSYDNWLDFFITHNLGGDVLPTVTQLSDFLRSGKASDQVNNLRSLITRILRFGEEITPESHSCIQYVVLDKHRYVQWNKAILVTLEDPKRRATLNHPTVAQQWRERKTRRRSTQGIPVEFTQVPKKNLITKPRLEKAELIETVTALLEGRNNIIDAVKQFFPGERKTSDSSAGTEAPPPSPPSPLPSSPIPPNTVSEHPSLPGTESEKAGLSHVASSHPRQIRKQPTIPDLHEEVRTQEAKFSAARKDTEDNWRTEDARLKQWQDDLTEREATIQSGEDQLQTRADEFQQQHERKTKELQDWEDSIYEQQAELQEREDKVNADNKDTNTTLRAETRRLEQREHDLDMREADIKSGEDDLQLRSCNNQNQENDMQAQQQQLEQRVIKQEEDEQQISRQRDEFIKKQEESKRQRTTFEAVMKEREARIQKQQRDLQAEKDTLSTVHAALEEEKRQLDDARQEQRHTRRELTALRGRLTRWADYVEQRIAQFLQERGVEVNWTQPHPPPSVPESDGED